MSLSVNYPSSHETNQAEREAEERQYGLGRLTEELYQMLLDGTGNVVGYDDGYGPAYDNGGNTDYNTDYGPGYGYDSNNDPGPGTATIIFG